MSVVKSGIQYEADGKGGGSGTVADELDAFLGLVEGNAAPASVSVDTKLPDSEEVPEPLRGKTVKEAVASFKELQGSNTKLAQEKADLVRALEGSKKPANPALDDKPTSVPAPQVADLSYVIDELVEAKLDRYFASEHGKVAAPYREEIKAILAQVPDASARLTEMAIVAAARLAVGAHVDDIIKQYRPEVSASPAVTSEAAGGVPAAKKPPVALDDGQKVNLSLYFEGDMEAAKRSITGGGES